MKTRLILLLAALGLTAPAGAHAATLKVTSSAEHGRGTLRQEVESAASGDTILVGARSIVLTSGPLELDDGVTIAGKGARRTSISGGHRSGILQAHASLTLRDLTLRDGQAEDGGAIQSFGPLRARPRRAARQCEHRGGGAVASYERLTVTGSLFADNHAAYAGALNVLGSKLVAITNSTFAGNAADYDGGAVNVQASERVTTVSLVDDTFVGNRARDGAAFYDSTYQTVRYRNSVFAGNGDACEQSGAATTISDGHNVFDGAPSADCELSASDAVVADAALEPLGDNGGPIDTARPGPGSPALDAAADCPAADARGVARASACDAGAVELAPPAAVTGAASDVTPLSAIFHGTVDSHGLLPATSWFQWGATTAYGARTAPLSRTGDVQAQLRGIAPGTAIHYRLVTTTADGTSSGSDQTFTTAAAPTALASHVPAAGLGLRVAGRRAHLTSAPSTAAFTRR